MTPKRLFVITFAVSPLTGIILPLAAVRGREDLAFIMEMGFAVPWFISIVVFFVSAFLAGEVRKGVMRSF